MANNDGSNGQEVKQLTAAQRKKLFATAFDAYAELAEVEEGIEKAKKATSDAVKEIYDAIQEGKIDPGPFSYEKHQIGVGKKGDAYFFKKLGKRTLVKIA